MGVAGVTLVAPKSSSPTAERLLRVWDLGTATRPLCLAQVEVDPSTGAGDLTCMAPGAIPLQVIRRLLAAIDGLQTT